MLERTPKRYRYPLELISIAVWSYHRFNDSYRDVSERLLYRGIDVIYETIRQWCIKFGPQFKNVIKKRASRPSDKWHLDEQQLRIRGATYYLWRAVDDAGYELDVFLQKRRNKKAAIRFLSRLLNAHPKPRVIVTDKLRSYTKPIRHRESFTDCFSTAGNREILDRETIRKRLLLCNFAIGTNAGLKRTAGASKGAVTFEELRHIRNFFLNKDDLREAINTVVNAIFRIRNPKIWKSISTACAADSKQFGCFAKNLLTEWSPRHHSSGVMIYWHVSDQYICVYSQMKACTSSEVASMLQGIMDQETAMEIESQYVDSHGQSELGFALSYLEQFDLLPRYKTIGNQKLYLPSDDLQIKNIKEITTRAINWEINTTK